MHLVCHTHDDVGWLKTVDQYYVGSNNSIQHAGVEYILDSVVLYLSQNPNRKFEYVEQAFFQRWWRQQDDATKATVKKLIKNGQLSFTNGGYCMHDEGATHFLAMIDQTSVGHRYLLEQLDYRPTTGWQIDPFGHSATQAALLSAEVGFDALYFARMDYQDRQLRYNTSNLEFIWRASKSLGPETQIFTGQFIAGHYEAPSSFCYDQRCADPAIQDDKRLYDYNVKERVDTFVNLMYEYFAHSKGQDIMLTMGTDFGYENANTWFKNLEKLIKYVNEDGRVNVFYSTVQDYTDAKLKTARKEVMEALQRKDLKAAHASAWTVKTDDFFPYSDCPHCMWTGYFTSRSALKRAIREGDAYLQVAKQLESIFGKYPDNLVEFEEAMAIAQHHDAATGTSRQHVAYDYMKRIYSGRTEANKAIFEYMSGIATGALPGRTLPSTNAKYTVPKFKWCPLLNQTICDVSTGSTAFAINLYNALGRSRTELVRVPVFTPYIAVRDPTGAYINCDVLDTWTVPGASAAQEDPSAPYTLYFVATVPAMGFATYFVEPSSESRLVSSKTYAVDPNAPVKSIKLSSESIDISVSLNSGSISEVTDNRAGTSYRMSHDIAWYPSYAKDGEQNSGAYIFRPATYVANILPRPAKVEVYEGELVTEVRQIYGDDADWVGQTFRFPKQDLTDGNGGYIEVDYSVGPIPIDDNVGKEVVLRFNMTTLKTNGRFYTDSNGREFLERQRDYRPTWPLQVFEPISGNYYPIAQAAYIRDEQSGDTFGILTDRNVGGASISDGEFEVMVHRRTLRDDARGVDEPLNETQSIMFEPSWTRIGPGIRVAGTHRLVFNASYENAMQSIRHHMGTTFQQLWPSFAPLQDSADVNNYVASYQTTFSLLRSGGKSYDLPANVEVLTLQPWIGNSYLLRVAHNFAVGEHSKLSEPVTVDLAPLLDRLNVNFGEEYSLTGLFKASELRERRKRLRTFTVEPEGHLAETGAPEEYEVDKEELKQEEVRRNFRATKSFPVTVTPMKIRTFILE